MRVAGTMLWTALLASLAMLVFMARSVVTGQIPFTGDLLHLHYPLRHFYARQIASGQAFDWMPGLFGGFYVVGEGQLGGYHPLHWLLYRLLPLDRAFAIELVIAYPFLYAGTWLWLRRRCDDGAAAFGAMAVTFSGFMVVHGAHLNMVGVLAHVPWQLWALDRIASRTAGRVDSRGTALLGLLIGSELLLGHPQAVWFSGLICVAYAVYLMAAMPARRWRVGATWVAGAMLGLAIGSVQVLATLNAVARSSRPSDVEFAAQYSLRPAELLQVLHPYLFWGRVARWNELTPASDEYAIYGGGVVLMLAVWWVARQWQARRTDRFTIHVAAFGLLGLWLATGSFGKLYYLQTWVPLVSQFRAPVRYTVFAQWALAVLAALAVAHLLRHERQEERGPLLAVWGVVALAAASALWLHMPGAAPAATWVGPLLLALSAALLTLAVRGVRVAAVALVLLAAADQASYGLNGMIVWQDFVTRQEALAFLDTNSFLPAAGETRLIRGNYPNLYLLANHRFADGYVAITPSRQLDYRQPNALRVAQVEYAHADFFAGAPPPGGAEPRDHGWLRLSGALPRARLVAEAMVSRSPAQDIAKVDVARTALVTHALPLEGGSAGAARIVADDPGAIAVEVNAASRQLLVVSESFDDGWGATLDGQPVPVERVNGDFLGAVVPVGRHTVRLQFRPVHLAVGRYVSLGGLVVGLLLLWMSRRTIARRL